MKLVISSIPRKRSGRLGLLTDTERQFLKGKIKFSSKQKSKFFKSILARMLACKDDFNMFFDRRLTDKSIEGWCSRHFQDLYSLAQDIHLRNRLQLPILFLGRVRFKVVKSNLEKKGVRYYWMDRSAGPRGDFAKVLDPSAKYEGIKPASVRKLIIKADQRRILPTNEKSAITIKELKLKLDR